MSEPKPPPLYRCGACNVAVIVIPREPEPPAIVRGCACDASTTVIAQTTAVLRTVFAMREDESA